MQMNYSLASLRLKQYFKLTCVHMHEGERSNSRAWSSWNMFSIFRTIIISCHTTKQHIKKTWLDHNTVLGHSNSVKLCKCWNYTPKKKKTSWYKKTVGSCWHFRTKFLLLFSAPADTTLIDFHSFPCSGLSLCSMCLRLILNPSLAWKLNTAAQRYMSLGLFLHMKSAGTQIFPFTKLT